MAGDNLNYTSLSQPVKANEILAQERREFDDCLSCRIVGGTAFLTLGGYSYWEGMRQLENNRAAILKSKSFLGMRGRRAGIIGTSLGLAWMGIYRMFG